MMLWIFDAFALNHDLQIMLNNIDKVQNIGYFKRKKITKPKIGK